MTKNYRLKFSMLAVVLLIGSFAQAQFTNGVFILNEGGYGTNSASVSFLSDANALENDVYGVANSGTQLGDTAQSVGFYGDVAYIVLNGSNAVKVVNAQTFQLIATINSGLTNPRFVAFNGNKAYVTCWGVGENTTDDYVAVIDIATNTILDSIPVAEGPERIISEGSTLYVAHFGGYGYGNTVSVIQADTQVVSSIPVGDVPNSLVIDNGTLYVLCGGKPIYAPAESDGSLVKINLESLMVTETLPFTGLHPANLEIYNNQMYYSEDAKIFVSDLASTTLPVVPLFTIEEQGAYGVYGMDFIDGQLYVADAGDYASPGKAFVYSTAGTLLETYTVGIIPSNFYKAQTSLGVVQNLAGNQIIVYPNPTSERFFINTTENASIKMFDVAGRTVKNQLYSVSGVDVTGLNSGIYLVEISVGTTKSVKRISIK